MFYPAHSQDTEIIVAQIFVALLTIYCESQLHVKV